MMVRKILTAVCAVTLFGSLAGLGTVAHAQEGRRLNGTWSVTGTTGCVNSEAGFNGLQAISGPGTPPYTTTFSVELVATLHGNGTGSATGRAITVVAADLGAIIGSGNSSEFTEDFTYVVGPGNLITLTFNSIAGTILAGSRAGQTFTVSQVVLVGHLGLGDQAITLATNVPNVETVTYSGAPTTEFRLCHRSRVLIRD